MRLLLIPLLLAAAGTGSAESQPAWPHWGDAESIDEYARRANLPPTKTLDLGNGVKLELVLIPAGTFRMGTPMPEPVDEWEFRTMILIGQVALAASGGTLLVVLTIILVRAVRGRQRPQFSLAQLLWITGAGGVGLLGGLHWFYMARTLSDAQSEYQASLARFKNSDDDEKPAHDVTIGTPYYVGKFEVTQEQYLVVMGANPSLFRGRDLPVEKVTWDDAQAFCKKVSEMVGATVRLPSEAEWERACRAGTRTTYYTGDAESDLDGAAWYDGNSKNTTHPVGQKTPSAWGVYDMHGNVWEWCADWYGDYKAVAVVDPQGRTEGKYRVLRGGSWVGDPGGCRSAGRGRFIPDYRGYYIGFRVVWLAPRTP